MKFIKIFLLAMLFIISFVIMYMKAHSEKIENPELKGIEQSLNGHYIVGTDTIIVVNGKRAEQ